MTQPTPSADTRATNAAWKQLRASAQQPGTPSGRSVLVVSSCTINPIEASLGVAIAAADGATPRITFADYNQIFQVCLDPVGHGADNVDEIVIIWRLEDVFERDFHRWGNLQSEAESQILDGAASLAEAVRSLVDATPAHVTVSDATTPIGFGLDHADLDTVTELTRLQNAVNAAFDGALGAHERVGRLRLAALQHATGTTNAFNRRNWLMYRQPFTASFAHSIGVSVADLIAGRTNVPPKVLVLDCDDTLWGGIAANDGISNLKCSDAFPGSAYREFQMVVQRLRHRGVLLGIASKNDRPTVDQAFVELDGMVLTPDDITGWRVSWNPKPGALAELAAEFNLGIDSFVFVDDSDYEVGAVRSQLPEVVVLQVPADIEQLPDLLAESGLFRMMRVTDDDRERTGRMLAESSRSKASTTMSHEEFLASLQLNVTLAEVGEAELGRVTQLINKTNQFNLTTRRRDQAEVAAFVASADAAVFSISVDDRFGEYGIVGAVVAVVDPHGEWSLDTVLMSCRVLGRGVETAMLAGVVATLRTRRPGMISGTFIPTDRNQLVADLLPRHGFESADGIDADDVSDGTVRYVLAPDRPLLVPDHITLRRP